MRRLIFQPIRLLPVLLLASCSYLPEEQTLPSVITVYEYRNYIEITPSSGQCAKTGLVFYPGGLVDPHAYVEPLSRFAVSGKGHKVVIVKMPGNLAVLDSKQGAWIYDHFPAVDQWVIGGHSLGGVMACTVVKKYPDFFPGIVLMAAYPQESSDLSDWDGVVLSMLGQYDGLVDSLEIASYSAYLPRPVWISGLSEMPADRVPHTVYHIVPGANHSQFGNYGKQKGDGEATITREEQALAVSDLILRFFIVNGFEYDKD